MNIPTFGQDPHPDEIIVPGITVILYDPKTNLYGCLHDTANPGDYWLISGGANNDEDFVACAKREVQEETGYDDIKEFIPIVPLLYSRYRHPKKQKNFKGEVRPFVGIMNSLHNQGSSPEEHEKGFEPIRVSCDAIKKSLLNTGDQRYGKGKYDHRLFLLDKAQKIVSKYENK